MNAAVTRRETLLAVAQGYPDGAPRERGVLESIVDFIHCYR
jgi:hypothetical protein